MPSNHKISLHAKTVADKSHRRPLYATALGTACCLMSLQGQPAIAQTQSPVVNGRIEPVQEISPTQLAPSDALTETKKDQLRGDTGLGEKLPAHSAAREVRNARIREAEAQKEPAKAPLSSIISANAEMRIDNNAVILGAMRGLAIEVVNNTDRPLIFWGDKAIATIGENHLHCAPLIALEEMTNPVLTLKEKVIDDIKATTIAGGSIGGIPTLNDINRQAGPILGRYGGDEDRREGEISRFGKRVVWPGDTTKGVVYFVTKQPLTGASIDMPVSALYDSTDQSSVSKSFRK